MVELLIIIAILVILMSDDKPMNAMYGQKVKLNLDKIKNRKEKPVETVEEAPAEPIVENVPEEPVVEEVVEEPVVEEVASDEPEEVVEEVVEEPVGSS